MADAPLITITECAERLTALGDVIERSGLSRYVKDHNLRRAPGHKSVSFDEVRAHRQTNTMRTLMRGEGVAPVQHIAQPGNPAPTSPANDPAPAPNATDAAARPIALRDPNDPVYRKRAADAASAELDLERKRGNLVELASVEAAIGDLFAALREAESGEIGGIVDKIVVELKLNDEAKRFVRAQLKAFSRALQARMVDTAQTELSGLAEEPRSVTGQRLDQLKAAAFALRKGRNVDQALSA